MARRAEPERHDATCQCCVGEIHTIKEIYVHSREEKNLMISPYTEFGVTINCQGIYMEVKLIFYKKECRWVMVTGRN